MELIVDLHIHSHLSRACSKSLHPETLDYWCQLKGINVLATGDFTHPAWIKELEEKLVPAEPGLFSLRPDLAAENTKRLPVLCRAPVRFLLGVEISCIYKRAGRVRKAHHLVFAPSFDVAKRINEKLGRIGNIKSDGRPILGLDSRDLLSLVRETDKRAYLIPAHAWTPHFAVFGSESGFDSLEECFGDQASEIFAIETGLSSDPPMNWRLSALDRITLISNSDAHSPEKLAREANVMDTDLSYDGIFEPMKKRDGRFKGTLEFFPEEGKYHVDGHRNCDVRLDPAETIKRNGACPVCEKQVTVGVLHRIEKLADRPKGQRPPNAPTFENIIPLREIIGQTLRVGPSSVRVDRLYHKLLSTIGTEFFILRHAKPERIAAEGYPLLALGLKRMRAGEVEVKAGFDGEFGVITVIKESDFAAPAELSLL